MSDVKLTHPDGSVVETTEQYAEMYETQGFVRPGAAKASRRKPKAAPEIDPPAVDDPPSS